MNTIEVVVGMVIVFGLGYAWYTERTRRRVAEIELETTLLRSVLDEKDKKLEADAPNYETAKKAFQDAAITADMLEHLGKPLPSVGVQADRGGGGQLEFNFGSGTKGKAPTTP